MFNRLFGEYKRARKLVVAILGASILIIGILMLLAPGPAFIVIPAGLAVLATEFGWARRVLAKLKKKLQTGREKSEDKRKSS